MIRASIIEQYCRFNIGVDGWFTKVHVSAILHTGTGRIDIRV